MVIHFVDGSSVQTLITTNATCRFGGSGRRRCLLSSLCCTSWVVSRAEHTRMCSVTRYILLVSQISELRVRVMHTHP